MTLEEALDESMRKFLSGKDTNEEMNKIKPSKYTLDYFNDLQEQLKNPPKESRLDKLKKGMR